MASSVQPAACASAELKRPTRSLIGAERSVMAEHAAPDVAPAPAAVHSPGSHAQGDAAQRIAFAIGASKGGKRLANPFAGCKPGRTGGRHPRTPWTGRPAGLAWAGGRTTARRAHARVRHHHFR